MSVTTTHPKIARLPIHEEIAGNVVARYRPVVAAQISGTIKSISVDVGDKVSSGQVRAEIESRETQARLDQILPQLARTESDLKRYKQLLDGGAVSQSDYDDVQARLNTLKASAEEARIMLNYSRITSPIDGIVRARRVESGDLASPGKSLFELESVHEPRFEASIPESLSGKLHKGDRASVDLSIMPKPVDAVLAEITPSSDPYSRTFLARYDLLTSATLSSGQFGRLILPIGEKEELVIPTTSLVRRGQLEIVFVMDDGKAKLRIVRTGRIGDQTVSILSGLNGDETIIDSGASNLVDGQRVEVQP